MSSVLIQIWFDDDAGSASITYIKSFSGKVETAHDRFTRAAMRRYPSWRRITVKTMK